MLNNFEQEECKKQVEGDPDEQRPESKKFDRSKQVKPIEKKINPLKKDGPSAFSKEDEDDDAVDAGKQDKDQQLASMMPQSQEGLQN